MPRDIRIVDSITQPDTARGTAMIAGSHGGISSGGYAARLGLSGVVFNDAGVGYGDAGVQSLALFDDLGAPAATVDHESARIGDGVDSAMHGTISHVNEIAEKIDCHIGQSALACVATMDDAGLTPSMDAGKPPELRLEQLLTEPAAVWLVDSLGQVTESHQDAILVCGSHGARLAGERSTFVPTRLRGLTVFDAGRGKDQAGIGRLASMNDRGIPAAAVDVHSARIGDARSAWEHGIISTVNERAASIGVTPGTSVQAFVDAAQVASER